MRILFVCMGNICRSPSAAAVLRFIADNEAAELQLEIDSAGTHAYHLGCPPDTRAALAAQRRGIDMSALRARKLTRDDFEYFDLILTMDERNKLDALAIAPATRHERVHLFLEYAPNLGYREIPDPYFGNRAGFELVLDLVTEAARGLIAQLRSTQR